MKAMKHCCSEIVVLCPDDIQPYYKDPRKSRKKRKGQAVEEEEEDTDTNAIGLEEVLSIPDCRKVLHKYMQKVRVCGCDLGVQW